MVRTISGAFAVRRIENPIEETKNNRTENDLCNALALPKNLIPSSSGVHPSIQCIVEKFPNVSVINATNCTWLSPEDLLHLAKLEKLTTVILNGCTSATNRCVFAFTEGKSLNRIEYENCPLVHINTSVRSSTNPFGLISQPGFDDTTGKASLLVMPSSVLGNIQSFLGKEDLANLYLAERRTAQYLFESADTVAVTYKMLCACGANFTSNKEFELDMSSTRVSGESLRDIVERFPNISEINVSYCLSLKDEDLKEIAKLTRLKRLDLRGCNNITDAGLEAISKLAQLQWLDLYGCKKITDAGLEAISKLMQLQRLDLRGCDNITDAGLEAISKLMQLQWLDLGFCNNITDAGLEAISKLTQLQWLDLRGCYNITNAGRLFLKQKRIRFV